MSITSSRIPPCFSVVLGALLAAASFAASTSAARAATSTCFENPERRLIVCIEQASASQVRLRVSTTMGPLGIGLYAAQADGFARVASIDDAHDPYAVDPVARVRVARPWARASGMTLVTRSGASLAFVAVTQIDNPAEVGDTAPIAISGKRPRARLEMSGPPGFTQFQDLVQNPSNHAEIWLTGLRAVNARGGTGALLHSSDEGRTWTHVLEVDRGEMIVGFFSALSISQDGTRLALALSTPPMGDWSERRGSALLLSADGGRSFTRVEIPESLVRGTRGIQGTLLSPDGNRLYAFSDGGVVIAMDWAARGLEVLARQPDLIYREGTRKISGAMDLWTEPGRPDRVFAGSGNHVFRLETNGKWSQLSNGVFDDSTVYNIEFLPNHGLRISTCNGIYETRPGYDYRTDARPVFAKRRSASFLKETPGGGLVSSPGYLRAYWVESDPRDSRHVVAGGTSGLYQSRDSGATWVRVLTEAGEERAFAKEYYKFVWLDDGSILVRRMNIGVNDSSRGKVSRIWLPQQ